MIRGFVVRRGFIFILAFSPGHEQLETNPIFLVMKTHRTLGKRSPRPAGELRPPTSAERQWVLQMAQHGTRVPKGLFRYHSMVEANADWNRWHAELAVEMAGADIRPGPDQHSS
jgi:hypothetical protein